MLYIPKPSFQSRRYPVLLGLGGKMKFLIPGLSSLIIPISTALAAGPSDSEDDIFWKIVLIAVSVVLTGVIGYFIGTIKFFREEKHKAYGEMIPPILKMAYHPQDAKDEQEYSKALIKVWLYGSKKVALKMEEALKIMHDPARGNVTKALQDVVAAARKDIQLWQWQRLKPEDINHLYTRIVGEKDKYGDKGL
jgi:hypothetical protein